MSDAISRAARTQGSTPTTGKLIQRDGWTGPTLYPPLVEGQPPRMDYSTWVCPHETHCLHPMTCWRKVARK